MLNLHLGRGVIQAWRDPRDCFVHTAALCAKDSVCVNMELLKKSLKMYTSKDVCPFRVGHGVGWVCVCVCVCGGGGGCRGSAPALSPKENNKRGYLQLTENRSTQFLI